jgi:large subunit ribosomal protein L12e
MAKNFKGTVKEMLGTAVSVGCTVDGENPREIQAKIDNGQVPLPDE